MSSFSSDSLAAPEQETEANNLQIAVARILRGIDYLKRKIIEFFQITLLQKCKASTGIDSADEQNGKTGGCVQNHTIAEINKAVDYSRGRTTTLCSDPMSFIDNPHLTVTVPIAVGESDFEHLNTEELSSISETEESKEVRNQIILQICTYCRVLERCLKLSYVQLPTDVCIYLCCFI